MSGKMSRGAGVKGRGPGTKGQVGSRTSRSTPIRGSRFKVQGSSARGPKRERPQATIQGSKFKVQGSAKTSKPRATRPDTAIPRRARTEPITSRPPTYNSNKPPTTARPHRPTRTASRPARPQRPTSPPVAQSPIPDPRHLTANPHSGERLQKVLANAGVASRRAAEEMIAAGLVTVNGQVVREMGSRAMPGDSVEVEGKRIRVPDEGKRAQELVYIALNKPAGVVSTAKDTHGRATVLGLVGGAGKSGTRLYPVGRLDTDTTGLLLLTNDGDLTFRLTHPRYGVDKEYRVVVRGRPGDGAITKLREGVELEEGVTAPAKVDYVSTSEGNSTLRVVIHEGRKRQVRLMMAAVGHPVIELERSRFGPIELGTLEKGKWRYLATHEVHALRKAARLPARSNSSVNTTRRRSEPKARK